MFDFGCCNRVLCTFVLMIIIDQNSAQDDSTAFYFPGSVNLDRLLKLNNVKMLRKDLIVHQNYVKELIGQLDRWAFNEIKKLADYESLTNYKIIWLEKEVNLQRSKVNNLTDHLLAVESINTSNLDKIKEEYSMIKKNVEILNDHFGEKTINSLNLLKEYYGDIFPDLIELHKDLLKQVVKLYGTIQDTEKQYLIQECIENIQNGEYELAVNKLNLINPNDDVILSDIIQNVYNKSETNFEHVLKFGDKIRNITKSFHVYKILMYEMELNQHIKDGNRILELIKSLKTEVIYQLKTADNIKQEALALEAYLRNKLKTIAMENLKEAILQDSKYYHIPFLEKILLLDEILFGEINLEIIRKFYADNGSFAVFGWIIEAFTEILWKIHKNHASNDETVMKYANFLKYLYFNGVIDNDADTDDLIVMDSVENLESGLGNILKDSIESFKRKLPESVRNVIFNREVCIKNLGLGEYLEIASVPYNLNKFNVFTKLVINSSNSSAEDITDEGLLHHRQQLQSSADEEQETANTSTTPAATHRSWTFTRLTDNIYHINSLLLFGKTNWTTYLYTSDIDQNDDNKSTGHLVFAWIPDETIKLGIWKVIPNGEYCFLKNIMNNEYLSVSMEKKHFAYSLEIDTDKNVDYWKWLVTDCNVIN